jgi:hypothetical protein
VLLMMYTPMHAGMFPRVHQQAQRALQASQVFLLRTIRKRDVEVVGGDNVHDVDMRLQALYHALGTSLDLQHWKFEEPIKRAIAAGDDGFARLCQAAEPLTSLVRPVLTRLVASSDPTSAAGLFCED